MSSGGGDTGGDFGGGGGGGGGGDSGGTGKGGSSNSSAVDFSEGPSGSSGGSSAFTSPAEQNGFQGSGAMPPEITTGNSGSSNDSSGFFGGPSINDFVTDPSTFGGGNSNGLNLAGPGPVGGGLPSPGQDTGAVGGTAPDAGGGTSALGFAAPAGVSGTPDLSSLVSAPSQDTTGVISPSDQGIFDSLNGAQTAQANSYADTASSSVPSAPGESTTLPATTPAAGTGGSSSGSGGGGTSQTTGILPGISNNNLGVAAAGAGLLNNLVTGNKAPPQSGNLTNVANSANLTAAQQTEAGQALQQYIATGKLPQGYEDQVQQAAQAAKQTIISNYASRGLPTDPTHNSALAQELNQVDARLPAAREQIASQLAQTGGGMVTAGLQASGISSGVYTTLANLENSQNQQRGQAIANFASALNGGNKGVTLNLGNKAA